MLRNRRVCGGVTGGDIRIFVHGLALNNMRWSRDGSTRNGPGRMLRGRGFGGMRRRGCFPFLIGIGIGIGGTGRKWMRECKRRGDRENERSGDECFHNLYCWF